MPFSQSAVNLFHECETKFVLMQEGWRKGEPTVGKGRVAASMGSAFHAAAAVYHIHRMNGTKHNVDDLHSIAVEFYETWKASVLNLVWDDKAYGEEADYAVVFRKMIEAYIKTETLTKMYEIVAVEETFPEKFGSSTPDLILKDRHGLVCVDIKTRRYSSDYYKRRDIADFPGTTQMLLYTLAIQELHGETCDRCILALVPRNKRPKPEFHTSYIDTRYRDGVWWAAMQQTWKDMHASLDGERTPKMSPVHRTNFGACPFISACMNHCLNRETMPEEYRRVDTGTYGD